MKLLSLVIRASCKTSPQRLNVRFFHDKTGEYTVVNGGVVSEQLKLHSVLFREGFTCIQVKKCVCVKGRAGSGDGTDVFINKRTGFFLCERCKVSGEWESYKNILDEVKTNKTDLKSLKENLRKYDKNISEWDDLVEKTDCLRYMTDVVCEQIFNEFKLNRFSRTVIENLDIRISKDKSVLYFPLKCLEFVVGYKTLNKNWEENVSPRIDCPGLLSSTKAENTAAAVVVGRIPDFLTLTALNLRNYEIVCLPYGASSLPQMCLPFFEKYKRIILWLGENCLDKTGNIVRKLNEKRCYLVKLTENQKSASTALSQNLCIKDILNEAKLTYHQYVTTFSSLRDDILVELQNHNQVLGVPWKSFPALTDILKGHRRGEMTVLSGPTGVGKTTFLSQYSLDLAKQGVYTLWGSFEIKNIRLAKIMLTQFAEAPLPKDLAKYNELCDQFEQLPLFFLAFHGQQNIKNVMDAVYHCSYTYDIAHVIIDNVQFMIEVFPDSNNLDRFSKQDFMIQMFRSFASKNNCHVTLVMHPKKVEGLDLDVNSIFGGVKATQEADNILIIQKKLNEYGMKKSLEVVKNRFSGDLGSFPLYFDRKSLSFSQRRKLYENTVGNLYSDRYSNNNEKYFNKWNFKNDSEELNEEAKQEDEQDEEECGKYQEEEEECGKYGGEEEEEECGKYGGEEEEEECGKYGEEEEEEEEEKEVEEEEEKEVEEEEEEEKQETRSSSRKNFSS